MSGLTFPHISFRPDGLHRSQAKVIYKSEPPHADILSPPELKHHHKKRPGPLHTQFKCGPGWRVEYA